MRVLAVHLDHLSVDATHTVGESAPADRNPPKPVAVDTCLGAFVGVEASDGARVGGVVETARAELLDASRELNVDLAVVIPCPHLVDSAASDEVARTVVTELVGSLGDDLTVRAAPVGWHLAVDLDAKGHPFSVRSRRITGVESADDGDREGDWFVYDPAGDRPATVPISEGAELSSTHRRIVEDDSGGHRFSRDWDVLAGAELATPDETRGPAPLRWTPSGLTMRRLVREAVERRFDETGATPVETPDTYDPGLEAIREHVAAATETAVAVDDGGQVFRTALCPGHLAALRDATVPATVYETGTCFRRVDPDGATGAKGGVQSVTLTEAHTATATLDAGKTVFTEWVVLSETLAEAFGVERVPVVRVRESFYADHRGWLDAVLADLEETALLERRPDGEVPTDLGVEFRGTAGTRPRSLGWVRLDRDGPAGFGVGDGQHASVLHCAPLGTTEALLAEVVETAGQVAGPGLPTWIAPTQVRFLPVDDGHVDRCLSVVGSLADGGVRATVDDRDRTVGARIDAAETALVPYYVVIGDRDEAATTLRVTDRRTGETDELPVEALAERVRAACAGTPFVPRRGPRRLSRIVV